MKKLLMFLFLILALTSCDSKENNEKPKEDIIEDVKAEKGTLDNPYTISEALNIIGTNEAYSKEIIYIKGIVTGKPYYNTKYSSYSVYLIDENGNKNVQVYSATLDQNLNNATVEEGDIIVAGGHYTYYKSKSQPELAGDTKTNVEYPVIYKITKGSKVIDNNYESFEADDRLTEEVTITFDEATRDEIASMEGKSYFWRKGNFIFENAAGERFEQVDDYLPYRLYVQTIVYLSVKTGTIKYLEFETDQNYPFTGDEQVENGKVDVVSKSLTRIYAAKGATKIRLRNQNDIQNKKQIRVKSIKIVYFK